jgi:nucleoside 2-deoxyribosyltransferase
VAKGNQVYLAGPIIGFSYDSVTGWRDRAKYLLHKEAFLRDKHHALEVYSPMRDYEKLKQEQNITCTDKNFRHIMCRDYNDCMTSDVVLMYLPASDKVSKGTLMEMAWCYRERIPLVCVTPTQGEYATHPMCAEAIDFVEATIEDGVKRVASILWP